MPRLRFPGMDDGSQPDWEAFRFPVRRSVKVDAKHPERPQAPDVLFAFEQVSRRMEDLARNLGCFGFFDDDDDQPRAA